MSRNDEAEEEAQSVSSELFGVELEEGQRKKSASVVPVKSSMRREQEPAFPDPSLCEGKRLEALPRR